MDPNQLAAVLKLIEMVGTLPLTAILLGVVIGPWLMAVVLAWGQERRFAAMKEMYLDNVKLVEGYEKVCQALDCQEKELRNIIMMNIETMTRLTDVIKDRRGS